MMQTDIGLLAFTSNLRLCVFPQTIKQRRRPPSPKETQHLFAHPLLSALSKTPLQIRKLIPLDQQTSTVRFASFIEKPAHRQRNAFRLVDRNTFGSHLPSIDICRTTEAPIVGCQDRRDCDCWSDHRDGNAHFGAFLLECAHKAYDTCSLSASANHFGSVRTCHA